MCVKLDTEEGDDKPKRQYKEPPVRGGDRGRRNLHRADRAGVRPAWDLDSIDLHKY